MHAKYLTHTLKDVYLFRGENLRGLQHFLTNWGRVTHICASKQTIMGSDNGLSPGWRQAIIWTNAGILLIGTLGTNFSEILIAIRIFSFKKMGLKVSSAKRWPFCLSLNGPLLSLVSNKGPTHAEVTATHCILRLPGRNTAIQKKM